MKTLLLGCGNSRVKRINDTGWGELTTVDISADCNPDIVCDLSVTPWLIEGEYDEIHIYEVLEHLFTQGDYRTFFAIFWEMYRLLKPGGIVCLSVPDWESETVWCDPGHRAVIPPSVFTFLNQSEYSRQIGKTSMTDYRGVWQGDFRAEFCRLEGGSYYVVLRKH